MRKISRWQFWLVSAILFYSLATPLSAQEFRAKEDQETYRIAIITWRGITEAERGFIDGISRSHLSIHQELFHASQNRDTLEEIIGKIQRFTYDLIYVFGTTATKAVLNRIQDTPVVFNIVNRPIEAGIIKSWEKSGNNATGASNQVPVENQLRTLKKVVNYSRLGILYNPREQNSIIQRNIARSLEKTLNFKTIEFEISSAKDISRLQNSLKDKVDAVYLPADSLTSSLGKTIARQINKNKLPSLAATESLVTEDGILLGLVPAYYQLGEAAARKAIQILEGEDPGNIPSSTLDYFDISVNMVTARRINVQIPISILVMANTIIR